MYEPDTAPAQFLSHIVDPNKVHNPSYGEYKTTEHKNVRQNRFGVWQSVNKGPRQHFGNRTVVFTNLDRERLLSVFIADFKLHEFEFEPELQNQDVPYYVQSMDLELEERLNDPFWREVYLQEYYLDLEESNDLLPLDVHEGGPVLRYVTNVETDVDGQMFMETLAIHSRGTYNCDTQEWKANVR